MSLYRIPARPIVVGAYYDPNDINFIWRIERYLVAGDGTVRRRWPAAVFIDTFGSLNGPRWEKTSYFGEYSKRREDGTYPAPTSLYLDKLLNN